MGTEEIMPVDIEANRTQGKLYITWSDGKRSEYDFEHLRWRCPCAACQGEGGIPGMLRFTERLRPEQYRLVSLRLVGNYAIAPEWADGHNTGIYTFDFLRALGPGQ